MLLSDPRIRSLLAQHHAAELRGQARSGERRRGGGRSLLSRLPSGRGAWPARTVNPSLAGRPGVPRI